MRMRRVLPRAAPCALAVLAFLRGGPTLETVPLATSGSPAAGGGGGDTAPLDVRPIGPNGRLCVRGAKGRLNNLIIQNLVAVRVAHRLNRTLIVDPEVSKYYDVEHLSVTLWPESPFRVAMASNTSEMGGHCCEPRSCSPYALDHSLDIEGRIDAYHGKTGHLELAAVTNDDAWYWLGRPLEDVYDGFFRGLLPRRGIREKAAAFMEGRGLEEGGYNALHLRHFEGRCGTHDAGLCCPSVDSVQRILLERNASLAAPLFVASDAQCPEGVLSTYTNSTDPVVMGFEGECEGTECAVLDFELCVPSDVFVGNIKSSGDLNIREWRAARRGIPARKSVLSLEGEMAHAERTHRFATRRFIGHWRFRPDCREIPPGKRGQPCA